MTYYIIHSIGDTPIVESIDNYSYANTVFEMDGKFFIKDTFSDLNDDIREFDVQVYPTKREAWKVAIASIDDFISRFQRIREETFHKAINDGAFIQTPAEFKKWLGGIQTESTTDLFEKRNKVK